LLDILYIDRQQMAQSGPLILAIAYPKAAHGALLSIQVGTTCPPGSKEISGNFLPTIKRFLLLIPCAPPSSAGWSGGVGEDCLSTKCEFRNRLTSRATQGTAQRRQTGGDFFWLLFLARQEK
jgi:hypothetical protein